MASSVYLTARPDYDERLYDHAACQEVLEGLAAKYYDRGHLCLNTNGVGVTTVTKAAKVWQTVKGWLGFGNATDPVRVNAELLKFLFYGVASGGISSRAASVRCLKAIHARIESQELRVSQAVATAFEQLAQIEVSDERDFRSSKLKLTLLSGMRVSLENYFIEHQKGLVPSFWKRLSADTITLPPKAEFGATYLALADRAFYGGDADFKKGFYYFERAAQLHNATSLEFRSLISSAFKEILMKAACAIAGNEQQLARIALLVAERDCLSKEYDDAMSAFQLAEQLHGAFQGRDRVLRLLSCVKAKQKNYGEAEKQIVELEKGGPAIGLDEHAHLVEGYLEMAAYNFRGPRYGVKLSLTPIRDYRKEGIACFKKALYFFAQGGGMEIFPRFLECAQQVRNYDGADDCSNFSSGIAKEVQDLERAVQYFLIAMHCKEPDVLLAPEGTKLIDLFTDAFEAHCLARGAPQQEEIAILDSAIAAIGDIRERFSVGRKTIEPKREGLVEAKSLGGRFLCNVGAKLHFLKAEILCALGASKADILAEYTLAEQLAPNHPFGFDALFAEDGQTSGDPPDSIDFWIAETRQRAIAWGAGKEDKL